MARRREITPKTRIAKALQVLFCDKTLTEIAGIAGGKTQIRSVRKWLSGETTPPSAVFDKFLSWAKQSGRKFDVFQNRTKNGNSVGQPPGKNGLLVTGIGNAVDSPHDADALPFTNNHDNEAAIGWSANEVRISCIGCATADGPGGLAYMAKDVQEVKMPSDAALVKIQGDGMSSLCKHGEFVMIHRNAEVKSGDPVVAYIKTGINAGLLFRYIHFMKDEVVFSTKDFANSRMTAPIIEQLSNVDVYKAIGVFFGGFD